MTNQMCKYDTSSENSETEEAFFETLADPLQCAIYLD